MKIFTTSMMATSCRLCNKTHSKGNNVPHSKKKTRRSINANLQPRVIDGVRVKVCAKCIKKM